MGSIDLVGFKNEDFSLVESIPAHTATCFCLQVNIKFSRNTIILFPFFDICISLYNHFITGSINACVTDGSRLSKNCGRIE